jgi:lipoprotein NlpI
VIQYINDGSIPLEAQYLYRQALSLSTGGQKEKALNYLRQAVLIAPRFCKAFNAMGNCLEELGRFDEAMWKFNMVIEIDPHHEEARHKREMIRKKIGFSVIHQ